MMNTSKQVENQHLMETGGKEENSRWKTEREKTVLRNHDLCLVIKWFVQVHFFRMLIFF